MKACVMSDLTEYGRPQRCLKCTHGLDNQSLEHTHTLKCFFTRRKTAMCHFWGWKKVICCTNETLDLVLLWEIVLKDSLKSFNWGKRGKCNQSVCLCMDCNNTVKGHWLRQYYIQVNYTSDHSIDGLLIQTPNCYTNITLFSINRS